MHVDTGRELRVIGLVAVSVGVSVVLLWPSQRLWAATGVQTDRR